MDTLEGTIRIVFSTANQQHAMDTMNRIVQSIEFQSELVEDVYIDEAPTSAGE